MLDVMHYIWYYTWYLRYYVLDVRYDAYTPIYIYTFSKLWSMVTGGEDAGGGLASLRAADEPQFDESGTIP